MKRVFAFIGFSCAITLFILNYISSAYVYVIMCAAAVLLALSLIIKSVRQAKALPTVFGSVLFACLVFVTVTNLTASPQTALDGKYAHFDAQIISEEGVTQSGYYEYLIKTSRIERDGAPQNVKVRVYSVEELDAEPYDYISGEISFISAENSYGSYGEGIYLKGILYTSDVITNESKPLTYYLYRLREGIKTCLSDNLDTDSAGLAAGILIGDKSLLTDETVGDFKISGMSHIMAVSGLHVGIIYLAMKYLLLPLKSKRKLYGIITLGVTYFYIALTGVSKSALRAGVMITVIIAAKMLERRADTLNSLGLACFIICLNPFAVTDSAAVLTVSAMLGVTALYPKLTEGIEQKNKTAYYLKTRLILAVSVILSTMPAMWLFFGKASVASIFANLIAIPFTQLALVSLLLFLPLSAIGISFPFLQLSRLALRVLLSVAHFIAGHFSFLYINLDKYYTGIALAAAFIITGAAIILLKKPNAKALALIAVIVIASACIYSCYDSARTVTVTVSRDGAVFVENRDNLVAIEPESSLDRYYFYNSVMEKNTVLYNGYGSVDCFNGVSVTSSEEKIFLTVYNNVFEISDDYVTINKTKLIRDIDGRYSQPYGYELSVRENSRIYLRRVDNG